MAKTAATPATDEQVTPEGAPELLRFRDKVYTSRLLIVPGTDRTLPVSKAVVEVPVSDLDAVKFLKANEEFEALKE
ncbi:hypothetical protein C1Y08_16320 [Pseudomonas sp. FW306-02-F02-AA]|uniref:Uncharacterized protein n=1 Tax=Pseudomonas fluorescens TaxID=294 RepID=A0A0N9WMJ3_PSEFL|nr:MULTISPECIES: hypothetical protein [Pseudomonas]ALI04582.1 hypothetical protein AO353_27315 [Pseudomonas fluorescens]PMZ02351.1 hypothetical protein C1Y07_20465 [Pseudomonas sp. FW306-02-F02-AB]PMZ09056.1 hypothetical protein C1Y06_15570 [Pseudomonas sp. FW306-02-H06C]PMZ14768.1 hypothetical protein C1Y08_16320 [Pseudomonas sp. FW306-02-F02-AA]PMZ19474.1 hypothetical protein C1Y09_23605 [Pseudomonas sp. FW306-02-F08-AA]